MLDSVRLRSFAYEDMDLRYVGLSKEVALNRRVSGSKPLPINLIKIIRLENETADDTGTSAGLGSDRDLSKHNILFGADCWGLCGGDDEFGALRSI